MNNKEILEKAKNEPKIDEREKSLFQKANFIAIITMSLIVIGLVITTAILKIRPAYFALLMSLFAYCAALFIGRYILYEKKVGILVGGILFTISCIAMLSLFIVSIVLGW